MHNAVSGCKHDSYKEYEVDGVGKEAGRKISLFVCDSCGRKFREQCEIWSRVVGYLRPVAGYNPGKKQEFEERKEYAV